MGGYTIEEIRENQHKEDLKWIREANKKYGFCVKRYMKVSNAWNLNGMLVFDEEVLNNDLKSCPFCDGQAELDDIQYDDCVTNIVRCKKCGSKTGEYDSMLEAFVAWNKRVEKD